MPRRTASVSKSAGAKRRRASYHHGDLRRALLAEAGRLVDEQGPEAFRLRAAARAVGVTHHAAYRHFADKRTLLAALATEGFEALGRRLAAAAKKSEALDPIERLRRISSEYVAFALEQPSRFHLMFGPRLNQDKRFADLETTIAGVLAGVVLEIKRGIDAGAVRQGDPTDLAMSLWTAVHGYSELVLQQRLRTRSKRAALDYVDVNLAPFLDGLRRR